MIAFLDRAAAQLHNSHAPPDRPVFSGSLLKSNEAVRDALQLGVMVHRELVGEDHRALFSREENLKTDYQASVTQRIPREEPQFRQGVENHPFGMYPLYLIEDRAHQFSQFDFSRLKNRKVAVGV